MLICPGCLSLDGRTESCSRTVAFDLLHIGHIRHFKAAAKLGGTLVVTVTPDVCVNKGPGRPAFSQQLRAEAIAELECVDFVAINMTNDGVPWSSAVETICLLKPNVYVKGKEYADRWTTALECEHRALVAHGGVLVFTDTMLSSSTKLMEAVLAS